MLAAPRRPADVRSCTGALRVLVVGPAAAGEHSRGGIATVVAQMAAHPDDRFHVTVVPTFIDAPAHRRLVVGVRGMVVAAWLVLTGKTDVLHVHLSHGGSVIRKMVPLLAARWAGVPSVVHGHSYNFGGWFDRLPPLGQRAVRAALHADHWVVLGERHAAEYASRLRVAPEAITVLPNAIALRGHTVAQAGAERVHAVAVGRLGERKGSYDLVSAVAALDPAVRARLRVTLAGDGDVAGVAAAVEAAGLVDTMRVVGWLDEAQRDRLLGAAHIFVLPSYDEGLPMALLEAMARGLAPVTTAVGSIDEVISNGANGLLIAPGDIDQLAAALTRLVIYERLRVRIGAAARGRVGHFKIERWYARLSGLWFRLADARTLRR